MTTFYILQGLYEFGKGPCLISFGISPLSFRGDWEFQLHDKPSSPERPHVYFQFTRNPENEQKRHERKHGLATTSNSNFNHGRISYKGSKLRSTIETHNVLCHHKVQLGWTADSHARTNHGRWCCRDRSHCVGGTNSNLTKDLIKYNILNKHKLPYDVIINAYATNDMHIHSAREAKKMHVTLTESVFNMNQSFIRTILEDYKWCKGRKLSLVLYYNDNMGSEQKGFMAIEKKYGMMWIYLIWICRRLFDTKRCVIIHWFKHKWSLEVRLLRTSICFLFYSCWWER